MRLEQAPAEPIEPGIGAAALTHFRPVEPAGSDRVGDRPASSQVLTVEALPVGTEPVRVPVVPGAVTLGAIPGHGQGRKAVAGAECPRA